MPKKTSPKPSKPTPHKAPKAVAKKANKAVAGKVSVKKAGKREEAAPLSNEQRIKSALKKLAGNTKNTPTIFKLPSRRATPMAFSLNEVRDLIKERGKKGYTVAENLQLAAAGAKKTSRVEESLEVEQKPRVLKSATLDDLLGSKKKQSAVQYDESRVPQKWMAFFKKLTAMRDRITLSVEERSAQTLKTSVKESAGDLSSYDMADAGTDTFDYDYALSMVSSEQDMLKEIDAAINRIYNGTYGTCEVTGKPIGRDRLNAVPFARLSKEGQDQYEKTRRRNIQRVGISSSEEDSDENAASSEEMESSE
jgi:RNA polymerase-binding transcription factor DksA